MGNFNEATNADLLQRLSAIESAIVSDEVLLATFGSPNTVLVADSVKGNDTTAKADYSYKGASALPFKTIAAAVAAATANSAIFLIGSFSEAVTCALAGVRFVGVGTEPSRATWTAPTVLASFCLLLSGASCLVQNIKFRPVIYVTSGIPAAIRLTTGANYTQIIGCRFQGQAGSIAGIYADAAVDNVLVQGNEFLYLNNVTTAPYGCAIYTTSTCASWRVVQNTFNSCRGAIIMAFHCSIILNNTIMYYGLRADNTYNTVLAMGIDLSAGYGCNKIAGNNLGGAYSNALYLKSATGDEWAGNWTLSVTATITNAAGMTLTATA